MNLCHFNIFAPCFSWSVLLRRCKIVILYVLIFPSLPLYLFFLFPSFSILSCYVIPPWNSLSFCGWQCSVTCDGVRHPSHHEPLSVIIFCTNGAQYFNFCLVSVAFCSWQGSLTCDGFLHYHYPIFYFRSNFMFVFLSIFIVSHCSGHVFMTCDKIILCSLKVFNLLY